MTATPLTDRLAQTRKPLDTITIKIRPCAPWCTQGDGHPDEHPDDRECHSQRALVALANGKPWKTGGGDWAAESIEVSLVRTARGDLEVLLYHHRRRRPHDARRSCGPGHAAAGHGLARRDGRRALASPEQTQRPP